MTKLLDKRYKLYSILLAVFLFVLLLVFLYFSKYHSQGGLQLENVKAQELINRGSIYDVNKQLLAFDETHNRLVFNLNNFNYYNNKNLVDKNELEEFISSNFYKDFSIDSLTENVFLSFDIPMVEKEKYISEFEKKEYADFLYFEDYIIRKIRDTDTNQNVLNMVGKLDAKTRQGLSGLEKEYNEKLLGQEDVELSFDFDSYRELSSLLKDSKDKFSFIAIDKFSGKLKAFYSTAKDIQQDELAKLFSFQDLTKSKVFEAVKIASMIEKDSTLIEEFYCKGQEPCHVSHGLVDLSNILSCPSAISNLLKKNYDTDDLAKIILQDFDISSKDLNSLIRLSFLAFSNDYIPKFSFLATFENSASTVQLKPRTIAFLKSALSGQDDIVKVLCDDRYIYIFAGENLSLEELLANYFAKISQVLLEF